MRTDTSRTDLALARVRAHSRLAAARKAAAIVRARLPAGDPDDRILLRDAEGELRDAESALKALEATR